MKASLKASVRLFKKHIARLITIIAIVMVSVGFMSGIGELENRVKYAVTDYYKSKTVSDFYIKSNKNFGFSAQEVQDIEEIFGAENLLKTFSYEQKSDKGVISRIYNYNFENAKINELELVQGSFPAANEVVCERATDALKDYAVGDRVTIGGREFTVSGSVTNPLLLLKKAEHSFQFENEYLGEVFYVNSDPMTVNDIYATAAERQHFNGFGKSYKTYISEIKSELEEALGDGATVLTLYENEGLYSMVQYGEKVGQIAIIFVVFFLLVTLLVVYSTMSRLLAEERGQIACLKTLGYSDFGIVFKYLLFVFGGAVIGAMPATGIGMLLTYIIYAAFGMQYAMPPFPLRARFVYFGITFSIILTATLVLTFFTGMHLVKNKPAVLLTPKAPKSGKKVLIERVPVIWNRLSFKHKSTMRNVFLFKSRFLMTVISIIGSTVLVLAGMGLTDCALAVDNAQSILAISVALIVFSALLCALVIYNLTNINVSERNREIATLMVLGYNNREVTSYIFREIYVLCFLGAILGLPLGVGFIDFVFNLVNFGAISDINWWTWILTPVVVMFFCFLSTMLLYKKITGTDMNASLKILE